MTSMRVTLNALTIENALEKLCTWNEPIGVLYYINHIHELPAQTANKIPRIHKCKFSAHSHRDSDLSVHT